VAQVYQATLQDLQYFMLGAVAAAFTTELVVLAAMVAVAVKELRVLPGLGVVVVADAVEATLALVVRVL
jgi:hypothetical protein